MFLRLKVLLLLSLVIATVNGKNFGENFKPLSSREGWFVGLGAGTQLYIGDHDSMQPIGYRFSTAMEVDAGKWITNSLAVRLQGNMAHVTGGDQKGKKTATRLTNVHADVMIDCINMIKGVDNERKFTIMPLLGLGWAKAENKNKCFTFTLGADLVYRASKHINLFTELKGILLHDKMDGHIGDSKGEGSAYLTAGINFNF